MTEKVFGEASERDFLIEYTKKAVHFAASGGCRNLVFGCPKNRVTTSEKDAETASDFFTKIADIAKKNGCVIALEPNPEIYGTNFINTTKQALEFIKTVDNKGLTLNVDLGTIIYNEEKLEIIKDNLPLVSHIHISEPYLKPIEKRSLHSELESLAFEGFYSIEMGAGEDKTAFCEAVKYIGGLLN